MSAIAYKLPPSHYERPRLELVQGPPHIHLDAAVYRRRRVIAAFVLLCMSALLFLGGAWTGERMSTPSSASSVEASAPAAQLESWTVRPGDTLWAIARSVQPQGDLRPLLESLLAAHGSRPLKVGEVLPIPPY